MNNKHELLSKVEPSIDLLRITIQSRPKESHNQDFEEYLEKELHWIQEVKKATTKVIKSIYDTEEFKGIIHLKEGDNKEEEEEEKKQ